MKYLIPFLCLASLHAAPPAFKEGTITLDIKEGKQVSTLLYQKKGNTLRIDVPGRHIPAKPINFIDLTSGTLRILRPHNATWVEVPAALLKPRDTSAFPKPPMPTGIGAHPGAPGTAGKVPRSQPSTPPAQNPPRPAQVPVIPKMPTIPKPKLPDGVQLPAGIGPRNSNTPQAPTPGQVPGQIPGQVPHMPTMPRSPQGGMPPMMPMGMGGNTQKMELKAHKETRTLHGYLCQKYTLSIPRRGVMTLWLSDAKDLPPFHLLSYSAPRKHGRMEWRQQWPAILREKNLFPFLAILRSQPPRKAHNPQEPTPTQEEAKNTPPAQGHEITRWEVTHITPKTIDDPDGTLFKIPTNFHKMQLPPF